MIADRVFTNDQLSAVITTYPGDPADLTIISSDSTDASVGDLKMEKIQIEGRPGWLFRCPAPVDTNKLTLRVVVLHTGRRFRVEIPFRRRKTYIAKQGKDVTRWCTRRERIRDLGPGFARAVLP